ncbi:MAG: helix-hairpin-helix domain-containing protein [Proteobacteria bacterium]|nr:helix-hairpin-helix domain-containing protein [Pseudomonadota bacterium]MBU1638978.1 helix-hairpin-helix domain-containing protein [Pseudomonadota bacterium]
MHPKRHKNKDERQHHSKKRGPLYAFVLLPSALILFFFCCPALADQININTATAEELTTLPYIGRARAQAIINFRRDNGHFREIDHLLKVESIGPKSLEAIRPHISISSQGAAALKRESYSLGQDQSMLLADDHYFPVLINFIKSAQHRIDVAMFLFKTTAGKNNKPAQLVDELIKAGKRGVQIEVVLENSGYNDSINVDNQQVAATLREHNIKVRFDSPNKTTHTKMVIIDNRFCFVGSHNLSHSALAFNHEMSLLLDNRKMAGELTDYIAAIQ